MGFLHQGHLSLVRKSKAQADITVVSVFVNPTQFAPNEDLKDYPRDIKKDKALLHKEDVDILFIPDSSEIYSPDYQTFVTVDEITNRLEGKFRPTHFRGVTTVVTILFNCIKPDLAFFGQKDAQQATVIKRMVNDLKFNIKVVVCPIAREIDGLALSSRNVFLNEKQRNEALVLSRSLALAKSMINSGIKNSDLIIKKMMEIVLSVDSSKPDYIKIVKSESFEEEKKLKKGEKYYVLIACKIGKTRLIDNLLIRA
jgi:pantoate--beta-alanine ligase